MIFTGIVVNPLAVRRCLSLQLTFTRLIFTQISTPNPFKWNTKFKKMVQNDSHFIDPPLLIYKQMLETGVRPDSHTFMYLVKALVGKSDISEGEEVHDNVVKMGFCCSQFVSSSLIGMYAALGYVDKGRQVFDEMPQPGLILWTAMMRAYVCVNRPKEALELFRDIRIVGLMPDRVTLATVVSACGLLGNLDTAKMIHGFISKSGIEIDGFVISGILSMYGEIGSLDLTYQMFSEMPTKNVVVWNTMIHQCVEHNCLDLAFQLFKKMPDRDVVSWNTMIGGLSQMGRCKEALTLFHEMEASALKPNRLTLSSTLCACASLGALDTGTWIHVYVEKNNMNSDGSLDCSLIDMYSKCGSINKAIQVFEKDQRRDLFSWTSIICGLAMHGDGDQALHLFSQMIESGVQPDAVAFVGVLNACAHSGLLDQGWQHFNSMEKVYNLAPKIEHYGCMIDLLGRMGCVKEAYDLIVEMQLEPNEVIWGALLSACRVHKNVEICEVAGKKLLELDPSDPWVRVMQSNVYAEASRWDEVMKLRKEMKHWGLRKAPGCSSIEINGTIHEFLVGDNLHPSHTEIHSVLEKIETMLHL